MKVQFHCLGEDISLRTSPSQTLLYAQKPVLFRTLPESGLGSLPSMSCVPPSILGLSWEHCLHRLPVRQYPCQGLPPGTQCKTDLKKDYIPVTMHMGKPASNSSFPWLGFCRTLVSQQIWGQRVGKDSFLKNMDAI